MTTDFVSGVVHWGLDNYGDGDTPFFGSQIAAFQGHHSEPWTITQRAFANNVHKVFKPATAPALVLLAAAPFTPSWLTTFGASLLLLLCLSQQTHAWAHKKPSQLPAAVLALQVTMMMVGSEGKVYFGLSGRAQERLPARLLVVVSSPHCVHTSCLLCRMLACVLRFQP